MKRTPAETPEQRTKRQVAELLKISREQGKAAGQAAFLDLVGDILGGRKR